MKRFYALAAVIVVIGLVVQLAMIARGNRNTKGALMSDMSNPCPACKTLPGKFHRPGCDVELCPNCGGQAISCGCTDKEFSSAPRIVWTGVWPGKSECIEFGWYCKWSDRGWVRCEKDDPDARPDLNRLGDRQECRWDRELQRFVKR